MVFVVAALYKRILLVSVIIEGRDTVDPGFYFIFIIPTFPPLWAELEARWRDKLVISECLTPFGLLRTNRL